MGKKKDLTESESDTDTDTESTDSKTDKKNNNNPIDQPIRCIYPGLIVWQYFIKGKRTFHEIIGSGN